jgi:hypothetical protein
VYGFSSHYFTPEGVPLGDPIWALTTFFYNARLGGPHNGGTKGDGREKGPPPVGAPKACVVPSRSAAGGHHAYMVDLGGAWVNPWPGNELDYSQMVIAPSLDEVGRFIGGGCSQQSKAIPQQNGTSTTDLDDPGSRWGSHGFALDGFVGRVV